MSFLWYFFLVEKVPKKTAGKKDPLFPAGSLIKPGAIVVPGGGTMMHLFLLAGS